MKFGPIPNCPPGRVTSSGKEGGELLACVCVCVCRRASQFRANKRKGKPFEKKQKKEGKSKKKDSRLYFF